MPYKKGQHIIVAAFPEMGHMIPMLSLSQNLVARGCRVTYVTSCSAANDLLKLWPKDGITDSNGFAAMRLAGIGGPMDKRGKSHAEVIWRDTVTLSQNFKPALEYMLAGGAILDTATGLEWAWEKPTGAICTTLANVPITDCLAAGLKTLVEYEFPVASLLDMLTWDHEELTTEEWRNAGEFPVAYTDLLADELDAGGADIEIPVHMRYSRMLRAGLTWSLRNTSKAHGFILNSNEAVEGREIALAKKMIDWNVPIVPVGPLLAKDAMDTTRKSLQPEVEKLLATNPDGSVLYVSFGSFINPPKQYLALVARALKERKQPFVWSLRYRDEVLEAGFEEEVKGFGCIVPWVDQRALLGHRKVGFFLSHMGWNSLLESLTAGKPLIGWPLAFDQMCNSEHLVDTYKVGFRFPKIFLAQASSPEEVLSTVHHTLSMALDTQQGADAKLRAAQIGRELRSSLAEGGTASRNKDWVVNFLSTEGPAVPPSPFASKFAISPLKSHQLSSVAQDSFHIGSPRIEASADSLLSVPAF